MGGLMFFPSFHWHGVFRADDTYTLSFYSILWRSWVFSLLFN